MISDIAVAILSVLLFFVTFDVSHPSNSFDAPDAADFDAFDFPDSSDAPSSAGGSTLSADAADFDATDASDVPDSFFPCFY